MNSLQHHGAVRTFEKPNGVGEREEILGIKAADAHFYGCLVSNESTERLAVASPLPERYKRARKNTSKAQDGPKK